MARPSVEQEIDRLYQLPLSDFTPARNAAAKELGGDEGKRVRALPKPSTSAWAVNQFYWHDRPTYDALIQAAQGVRSAHRAVLGGRKADLRAADAAHREALKAAIASALRLMADAGQQVSSATHMEISQTLEALPTEGAPGRLAKPLRPGGFEALQGMPVRPRKTTRDEPAREPSRAAPQKSAKPRDDAEERELKAAREREAKAARRALDEARKREREAQQDVDRHQKQVADAERKADAAKAEWARTQTLVLQSRDRLRKAEEELEQRGREVKEAETRAKR